LLTSFVCCLVVAALAATCFGAATAGIGLSIHKSDYLSRNDEDDRYAYDGDNYFLDSHNETV
jgi:hypothetical protein